MRDRCLRPSGSEIEGYASRSIYPECIPYANHGFLLLYSWLCKSKERRIRVFSSVLDVVLPWDLEFGIRHVCGEHAPVILQFKAAHIANHGDTK